MSSAANTKDRMVVWRRLLPETIEFSAGHYIHSSIDEMQETPLKGRLPAGSNRQRAHLSGRWHASQVMSQLGVTGGTIQRRGDGKPIWPPGIVGSISHTAEGDDTHVIACASTQLLEVGVDAELAAPDVAVWPQFMNTHDWGRRAPSGQSPMCLASWAWGLKESAYKASEMPIDPRTWRIETLESLYGDPVIIKVRLCDETGKLPPLLGGVCSLTGLTFAATWR